MLRIYPFTFNPFSENTYVVADDNRQCVIIDPGMSDQGEENLLSEFISDQKLTPAKLLNTHCHIDHILGNEFCRKKYGIKLHMHKLDAPTLARGEQSAMLFGVNYIPYQGEIEYLEEGDKVDFGSSSLDVVFVPGHAPGHIAFISHEYKFVIGGDVLFKGSVGRVDLPGCDPDALVKSIRTKFYTLADDYLVYPGHGTETSIGDEKVSNYFVRETEQSLIR